MSTSSENDLHRLGEESPDLDYRTNGLVQYRRFYLFKVDALSDEDVMIDANHPLAEHDLAFDIKLVEVI